VLHHDEFTYHHYSKPPTDLPLSVLPFLALRPRLFCIHIFEIPFVPNALECASLSATARRTAVYPIDLPPIAQAYPTESLGNQEPPISPQPTMAPTLSRRSIVGNAQSLVIRYSVSHLKRDASKAMSNLRSSRSVVQRRQDSGTETGIIPTSYVGLNEGMQPAAVAGIVIASVLGFLLLSLLLWWATAGTHGATTVDPIEEIREVRRHPRSRSPRSRRSRRSSHNQDIRHLSRSRSPRATRRTEIVEERIVRENRPPSRIVSRAPSPHIIHEKVIVEDRPRRHSGDNEIIVIEDQKDLSSIPPPRRHRSRRNSGYRPVDPESYAGGDYARRPVSRRFS
jgi:hypothetical protein